MIEKLILACLLIASISISYMSFEMTKTLMEDVKFIRENIDTTSS